MGKSISEHSNKLKLDTMKPLESDESSPRRRVTGRSSISSIPPPNPATLYVPKCATEKKKDEKPTPASESLCDVLCNSYKFVVNYGIFEPNFEWLPCEVNLCFRIAEKFVNKSR